MTLLTINSCFVILSVITDRVLRRFRPGMGVGLGCAYTSLAALQELVLACWYYLSSIRDLEFSRTQWQWASQQPVCFNTIWALAGVSWHTTVQHTQAFTSHKQITKQPKVDPQANVDRYDMATTEVHTRIYQLAFNMLVSSVVCRTCASMIFCLASMTACISAWSLFSSSSTAISLSTDRWLKPS